MDTHLIDYTASVRLKNERDNIRGFLNDNYQNNFQHIKSVFGFVEYCPLYGGRIWDGREISELDVEFLYNDGISLRLPLTNQFSTRAQYEQSKEFLEKYHRQGNSIILVRDDLAKWIREDFPLYKLEASIIKENVATLDDINRELEIYDEVVLHGKHYDNDELMNNIEDKSRIRLFSVMGCGFNCVARLCYVNASKVNAKMRPPKHGCSRGILPRPGIGAVKMDIERLTKMGFTKWKVFVPVRVDI